MFGVKSEWELLVDRVIKRDGGVCQYCYLTGRLVDIIDRRLTEQADANLVCCCHQCLRVAKNESFVEFEDKKMWVRAERNIPENNVTVIDIPQRIPPFRRNTIKKWTYNDRQRLAR